jgi:hypothetical protein
VHHGVSAWPKCARYSCSGMYVATSELDKDTALGSWKYGKQCGGFLTAEFVPDSTVVSADSLVFWR